MNNETGKNPAIAMGIAKNTSTLQLNIEGISIHVKEFTYFGFISDKNSDSKGRERNITLLVTDNINKELVEEGGGVEDLLNVHLASGI